MLKILGVLFLILIGLVVAFFTWLFFKVKGGVQQPARVSAIEEGMSSLAIVLEPTESLSFYFETDKFAAIVVEINSDIGDPRYGWARARLTYKSMS